MQTSIYYYRYFLRFSIRAIYQRLDKRNAINCRIHPDKRRYWWFRLRIWKANKKIWRPSLLTIIGRWIITTITLFHGSPHSPLAYGIFGELSHPCCPSQSIFPPPAVQTLATLFGNNWSVSQYCQPAFHCPLLDVLGSQRVVSLSIRIQSNVHNSLYALCSVWTDF